MILIKEALKLILGILLVTKNGSIKVVCLKVLVQEHNQIVIRELQRNQNTGLLRVVSDCIDEHILAHSIELVVLNEILSLLEVSPLM